MFSHISNYIYERCLLTSREIYTKNYVSEIYMKCVSLFWGFGLRWLNGKDLRRKEVRFISFKEYEGCLLLIMRRRC